MYLDFNALQMYEFRLQADFNNVFIDVTIKRKKGKIDQVHM